MQEKGRDEVKHAQPSAHSARDCNTLQHTAAHCNTLHHTAAHYNTLHHTTTHGSTLQHTTTSNLSPLSKSLAMRHVTQHNTTKTSFRLLQYLFPDLFVCNPIYPPTPPLPPTITRFASRPFSISMILSRTCLVCGERRGGEGR